MSRFRSLNLDSDEVEYLTTQHFVSENCAGKTYTVKPDIWSGVYTPRAESRTMTDIETAGFYKLRSEGKIVNSPMTQTVEIVEDDLVDFYQYTGRYKYDCSPSRMIINGTAFLNQGTLPSSTMLAFCGVTLQNPLSYDPQSKIDQAVSQAWSNMSLDEVQTLVIAAEMDKSIVSLRSILTRIIKIIRAVRKGNVNYLRRQVTFKELADRYMEVRYAIRPLVYDVAGVMSALQTCGNDCNTRQTFRGHKTYGDQESSSTLHNCWSWTYGGTWVAKATLTRTSDLQVDVRSGVLAAVQILSKLPYWGLHHPVEAMWELIPYSFVIDWVLNVSQIIASWTPEVGLRALASWYVITQRWETTAQLTNSYHTFSGTEMLEDSMTRIEGTRYSEISVTKSRVPDPSRPVVPSFNLRLDALKLLDLVVMAKNLLGH